MNTNQLILRNFRKNLKHYYLYIFALIFSVALYFAFVTLQYDPALDASKGSIKGGAALKAASILLVVIVAIFLLYANNIFIKRRSKEIGLFQLIGMTKGKIFRILSLENLMLYFGSLLAGIFVGFSVSRLILMILFKITGVQGIASLRFSPEALLQTVIVFAVIYVFIMLLNFVFVQRQSILSLFKVKSSAEGKARNLSIWEMILGLLGVGLIALGYYESTTLFSGELGSMNQLLISMVIILGSVIIGTYLFYKGSVSFLFNLIRKSKGGYLSLNEVLSLSSIMFRMKSNALVLTIITTVSALAIALLSLTYISYYSAEKSAELSVPNDFSVLQFKDEQKFTQALKAQHIEYVTTHREVIQATVDASKLIQSNQAGMHWDPSKAKLPVVSDASLNGVDIAPGETGFTGYSDALDQFLSFTLNEKLVLKGKNIQLPLKLTSSSKDAVVSWYFTNGSMPTLIVDQSVFERLVRNQDPSIQRTESSTYIGIDIKDPKQLEQANILFHKMGYQDRGGFNSQLDLIHNQKNNMGLIMFIVGFLGLAFLITSGCILYFKQVDEGEEEQPNYTILRKLGYTQGDILRGIQVKQLFNFGIPLVIGLLHSYFAIKSGWFFFGTELWTPMILIMLFYTALYSIFGLLSVLFYKKVIQNAL